jgi:hypothetical protein
LQDAEDRPTARPERQRSSELPEVSVAKVSRGSTFQFEPRRSLPLTVV